MKFSIAQIAGIIQAEIEGDPQAMIHDISKIEEGRPGTLTFLANPKYTSYIYSTQASAVIVNKDFQPSSPIQATLLRVTDAYAAFTHLLQTYEKLQKERPIGIEDGACVHPSAEIGEGVYIGAHAYIGQNVRIGANSQVHPYVYIGSQASIGSDTVLFPHTTVYRGCQIGSHCIIHANTTIGSDGFGFAPQKDGTYQKIPQLGIVIIEDHVEIGAQCSIDRATMGATRIKRGAKLDNLIQVAHNVEIGENTVIAAQTGISGSTKIGKSCMIGGQVGIVGHIHIPDQTLIGAQSGVSKTIKTPGGKWRGSPVQPYQQQLRSEAIFRQLSEMEKRLAELEKALARVTGNNKENIK